MGLFSSAYSQGVQIDSGLSWLNSSQNPTGNWGNIGTSSTTEYFSTSAVLRTLKVLRQDNTLQYQNGLQWLELQPVDHTAYLALRMSALSATGIDLTADISLLLSYKNSDGGWGGYMNYRSSNFHTTLALQALKAVSYSDQTVINNALSYLLSNQNTDSGFGFYSGDDSNIYMTALVSSTLQQFPQTTITATAINKATSFLLAHQNTSGGFSPSTGSGSTVYETSLAYMALVGVTTDATVLGNAINYLTSTQLSDGSWDDDPYSTALALRALYTAETRPTPPLSPTTGTIKGTVTDAAGNQPLEGVTITVTGSFSGSAATDAAGNYTVSDVLPGSATITASKAGYDISSGTVIVAAGSVSYFSPKLTANQPATGTIKGAVTDAANGQPISGAEITVTGAFNINTVTGVDGSFVITGVTPGIVTITAAMTGYYAVSGTGAIAAGGTVFFNVGLSTLPPTASTGVLTGKVLDSATNNPIPGAVITLSGGPASNADQQGGFLIQDIAPAIYQVTISATGYTSQSSSIMIIAGVTSDVGTLYLSPVLQSTTVTGRITDSATGSAVSGADVVIRWANLATKTDASGAYTITGITLPEFTIKASATGYNSQSSDFKTTAFGTYTADFSLNQSLSNLTIRSMTTDKQVYSGNDDVFITAEIENTGDTAVDMVVVAHMENAAGQVAAIALPEEWDPKQPQTIAPFSTVQASIKWNTAQSPPGDYSIVFKVTDYHTMEDGFIPGDVLTEKASLVTIVPLVSVTDSAVRFTPSFTYVNASETVSANLSFINRSNVPAELMIQHQVTTPSGAVISSGSVPLFLTVDMVSTHLTLSTFSHDFTETGQYPVNVIVYKDGEILQEVNANFVVLSNIRIDLDRSVTPEILLPEGSGKVKVTIALEGVEEGVPALPIDSDVIQTLPDYEAEVLASGLDVPIALKANAIGELFVAEGARDRVLKIALDGNVTIFAQSGPGTALDFNSHYMPPHPTKMDFAPNGDLYVGAVGGYNNPYNPYGDVLDALYAISPAGKVTLVTRGAGFNDIGGLAFGPDGYLYFGDTWVARDILKFNIARKTSTRFATSVYYPCDIAFGKDGNLYASMSTYPTEKLSIYRYEPDKTEPDKTRTLFNNSIGFPAAIAWGPDGRLYTADMTTDAIYTIDPATNEVSAFAVGLDNPYDLEFDSQGNLYVIDLCPGNWQVQPSASPPCYGRIIKISEKAGRNFGDVKLIEKIPSTDTEFILSSATKTPYSVTNTGDETLVEWRYDRIRIGQSETISFDLDLSNLIPGEDRLIDHALELSYRDFNDQEIRVALPALSVHVLASFFDSSLSTDKASYPANENVMMSVNIVNLSGYSKTIDARVLIEDNNGALVTKAGILPVINLAAGEARQLNNITFNTGSTLAGDYRAHLIIYENQIQAGEASANFTIIPDKSLASTITTDRISYTSNQPVTLASTITSLSPNYIFENLTATIAISYQQAVLSAETKTIPVLFAGQPSELTTYWNTSTNPPGVYTVAVEVKDANGSILSVGTNTFDISSSASPSKALKGQIAVDKQVILQGDALNITYALTNVGNENLSDIGVAVLTVHAVQQTVYDSMPDQTSLVMGQTYTALKQLNTQTYSAMDYLVILRASISGVEETLAGTFFRVEGAPSVPSLNFPKHGEDVETLTPGLIVNNSADPNDDRLTYEFELYSDSGLSNPVVSSGLTAEGDGITAWQLPQLGENSIYYWRARAFDGILYSEWMTPAGFRVNVANDPPTAPALSSPADNSYVGSYTPVLTVRNASDPDSAGLTYNFDLALDTAFSHIAASITGVFEETGTTSWQVPVNLDENTRYYWRAQADDWLTTGPWMNTASFFVNTTNEAPSAPVIIAPLNNMEITSQYADITAANSFDPDSFELTYIFETDTAHTFDSPDLNRSGNTQEGPETTSWLVSGLKDNTYYHVRAKASDGLAESPWSEVTGFFVNTANDAPTMPVLANPSNGGAVNVLNPQLSVHNSSDLDGDILTYEFEIHDNAAMTSLVAGASWVQETTEVTAWTMPVNLVENRTYYWRARAFDGALYSGWMQPASFMVNTANDAPGAPLLYAPAEGSSIAALYPTLSVHNASDPDSDALTYDFEIYSGSILISSIVEIPQGYSGLTAITLETPLSDNTAYNWRARAYDGDRFGPWMDTAKFSVHMPITNITATIDFDPNTLNKISSGKWVVVYIELPAGYNVADIDLASIRLEGTIPAESRPYSLGDYDRDAIPDLMVKFDRASIIDLLPDGQKIPVHIRGNVGTTTFEGVDVIRVIH